MRIVHVITRLLRAGSEENTLLTCVGQMAEGHEVILMHGHDALPDYARQKAPGIGLTEIPALTREIRPAMDMRAFLHMRRVLREIRPDVVHTHQSKAGIIGRFAAAAAGVPVVVHGVHIVPFPPEPGLRRSLFLAAERSAASRTDAFVHVSDGVKETFLENRIGESQPHHVIWSGFDLQRFAAAEPPEDWREVLGVESGAPKPPVIVMLAALEPRKRHLELVEELPELIKRVPGLRIVFAGEGTLHDRITTRAAELNISENVRTTGFRGDPEKIIAMADVCVHCAGLEGLPRSVLQYLAGGRSVAMFDLPGISDVIRSGKNGLLVDQENWPALIDALSDLLLDSGKRDAIASEARATDMARWDAASMGRMALSVYRNLFHCESDGHDAASGVTGSSR